MRAPASHPRWTGRLAAAAVILVAGAAVAAAIILLGGPAQQRRERADDKRASDFRDIISAISEYADTHGALPSDLETLSDTSSSGDTHDPETGVTYEYHRISASNYELCADFDTDTTHLTRTQKSLRNGSWWQPWPEEFDTHRAGRVCYQQQVTLPHRHAKK